MNDATATEKPYLIKPGEVRNPNGRPKGSANRIAERTKQAMAETLEALDPVALLHDWALNRPELFKDMWKAMLPKNVNVDMGVALTRIAHVIIDANDNKALPSHDSKQLDTTEVIELPATTTQPVDSNEFRVTGYSMKGDLTPPPPMNRSVG